MGSGDGEQKVVGKRGGSPRRRHDPLLWAQMKLDYENGMKIRGSGGMAEQYGRDPSTIREIARREGWVRKSDEPPVVTSIAVPEAVELDLNEQVLVSDIGTMDVILGGYASLLVVWRDLCERIKRGETMKREVFDTKSGQTYEKEVPIEISPFMFGHKDMKDFVKSIIDAQKQRKSLVDQLPMAKGVKDIEGEISEMAKLIQQGGLAGFQRSELPDVCYTEKKMITEKAEGREKKDVSDPEKDIEEELKKDGIYII